MRFCAAFIHCDHTNEWQGGERLREHLRSGGEVLVLARDKQLRR